VAICFCLHGKLDVLIDTAQVVLEVSQFAWSMWPNYESVVHIAEPASRFVGFNLQSHFFNVLHEELAMTGISGKPIATPLVCS
jgi:hypothetical protein